MSDSRPAISVHGKPGPRPYFMKWTEEELERAASLIRSGRATLEAACCSIHVTGHASLYRTREAGMEAQQKYENGESLNEIEAAALRFYEVIWKALAGREIILNRQALGDSNVIIGYNDDGTPMLANPRAAAQAVNVLQLTCPHWRQKQAIEHTGPGGGPVEVAYPEEVAALRARLVT